MIAENKRSRTSMLVEGGVMVALSYVLSLVPLYQLPQGGSVSLVATLPILAYSLRHNLKWSLGVATTYGFLQLMLGFKNVMYMKTLPTMVLCALLDYLLAYACLALAGPIARRFKNETVGFGVGIVVTGFLRFFCSFLSGVLLWTEYIGEGYTVFTWSLTYNGSWCGIDVALVFVAGLILQKAGVFRIGLKPRNAKEQV